MKHCGTCKLELPSGSFGKHTSRRDGLRSSCRTCLSAQQTSEKRRAYMRKYMSRRNQLPETKEYRRKHHRQKCANDQNFRLAHCLRSRLQSAIRGPRVGSAVRDLGCTVVELKAHLERQFQFGMSWENYGNKDGQWSIDHIRPLASFNLTDRQQFLEACHYTNLQPLWHIENVKKGSGNVN